MGGRKNSHLLAGLDIGGHKVCCFIAEIDSFFHPRLIGYGQHSAAGCQKRGIIVDMDRTETAIREAVRQAEDMAGEEISGLVVGVGGVHLRSHMTDGLVVLNNQEIGDADLLKLVDVARAKQLDGDRQIVHAQVTKYELDGQSDIRDPRGMTGNRLEGNVHIGSASSSGVRNVVKCVERCNLEVLDLVMNPYASALACLVPDEKELGVALIDIGGGTTDIAIYADNALVYSAVIPVGGQHITADIARGLSTPLSHAERIKTLYGCALASIADEKEPIEVPHVGEDDETPPTQITRSQLAGIIQPRCEEILELVRDKLEQSGFESAIGRRVVLTGGSSQLHGLRQLADVVLDKSARLARPNGLSAGGVDGLTDLSGGPQFSTASGLIVYGAKQAAQYSRAKKRSGLFGSLAQSFNRLFREGIQTS